MFLVIYDRKYKQNKAEQKKNIKHAMVTYILLYSKQKIYIYIFSVHIVKAWLIKVRMYSS